jgi:DNA-binding NarL/FixJ family response regulator
MAAMATLAIGVDAHWRTRMQRLLSARRELEWLGAYAPAQPRCGTDVRPALLLLDGDDPGAERERRCPLQRAPHRLYFYRHPTVAELQHCIASKANACLEKSASTGLLLTALSAAESGLFVAAPALLLEATIPAPAAEHDEGSALLTGRQREIVHWTAQGMSNKRIARQLGISPETVKSHLRESFQRYGVHGRIALLASLNTGSAATPGCAAATMGTPRDGG